MSSESSYTLEIKWTAKSIALVVLLAALVGLLVLSIAKRNYAEPLFIHATYYFLMVTVVCWVVAYLYAARELRWPAVVAWVKDNKAGIIIAAAVTVIAGLAIHPALRVLSDEANLLGTSKNFFFSKTATFTTTGKYYYDNFWDAGVVIDRRPSLFPFLVSFVHILRGYSYKNVFLFNLITLPVFVLLSYRTAKVLGGELVGIAAALLVVAHPITLISLRSGGFDFMAALFALLVIKSFLDHSRDPSPERLAVLWMNLCMFAEARYETAIFVPPVIILMLLLKLMRWELMRPFALIYALTPAYLLPRIWQSIIRGNVPEQDPGTITFSLGNFLTNTRDYFKPIVNPFDFHPPHSAIVIALGIVGCLLWGVWFVRRVLKRKWDQPENSLGIMARILAWLMVGLAAAGCILWIYWVVRPIPAQGWNTPSTWLGLAVLFLAAVTVLIARTSQPPGSLSSTEMKFGLTLFSWVVLLLVIIFTYYWGKAQHPAASRLVISIDTFFAFPAAYALALLLKRWRPLVTTVVASALFCVYLPVASEFRILNELTLTREASTTWRFFESLHEKRILIIVDRPGLYTIMEYGALDFETAKQDPTLLDSLSRRLFYDIYLVQQIDLGTGKPMPQFEIWPERTKQTLIEFQNDANATVRISRVVRDR